MFVDSVLLSAALNGERTGVSGRTAVGVSLVLAPVLHFMLYMLHHNYVTVVVTEDTVILQRLTQTTSLPFQEIVGIQEKGLGLPPNLVLKGERVTLRINRRAQHFTQLYGIITQRTKHWSVRNDPSETQKGRGKVRKA